MLCRLALPGGNTTTLNVAGSALVSEVIEALITQLKMPSTASASCELSVDNIVPLKRNVVISSLGTEELQLFFWEKNAPESKANYRQSVVAVDPKTLPVQDHIKLAPNLKKLIGKKEKGEFVIFSDKVKKINKAGKQQNRVVLLTNRALYNLKSRIGMDYVVQRRIEMEELTGLVVSLKSTEFVLQVHGHRDYHYTSPRSLEIADIMSKIYTAADMGVLSVKHLEVADLSVYVGAREHTQAPEVLKSGWLEKEGGAVQNWKLRWFVLYVDRLMYFKDQQATEPLKTILLTRTAWCQTFDGKVGEDGWKPTGAGDGNYNTYFSVAGKKGGRPFRLKARDANAAAEWVTAINHQGTQLAAVRAPLEGFDKEIRELVARKMSTFTIELYTLFTHMALVAPQSVGCEGLLTLIKTLATAKEEDVVNDVVNLLRSNLVASYVTKKECTCASVIDGSVCGILVRKAFEFCGGEGVIVRLWESLVLEGSTVLRESVFALLISLALASISPVVECCEQLRLQFIAIAVEEGRVYSERNKLDYALYDVRLSLGDKAWYVEKTFPELRNFMKSLEEEAKAKGLVIPNVKLVLPLLDLNTLSSTSSKALKSRANMFTDYFLALSSQANWNDILHLPMLQDFFEFRNVHRPLSCAPLRRAVETAGNARLTDTKLMDMVARCLFEALLSNEAKSERTKDSGGFNLKSAINGPLLPIYLTSLATASPQVANAGIGNVNILLSTTANVARLNDIPWKHTLLPFLHGRQPVLDTGPGLAAITTSVGVSVEISIKCRNLNRMDVLAKCDPVVEMYCTDRRGKNVLVGHTEVIPDERNPNFVKRFYIPYNPSQVPRQNLTFVLYDADHSELRRVDRVGMVLVCLHDLLTQQVSEHPIMLVKDKKSPTEQGSNKVEPRFILVAAISPYPEKTDLSKYDDLHTMETEPALLKEVRAAMVKLDSGAGAVMLDDQEVVLAYCPLIQHFGSKEEEMKNLLKHCVILTSRRVSIMHEGTNLTIWRNHISYMETFDQTKGLVVWMCSGEIIKAAPFNVNVMQFIHRVLSDDAKFAPPELQSEAFPRQAATQEHKLALLCLVQELLHRFRRHTGASSSDSFQSHILASIENLCQNTHWSRSLSLPCARAVLSALLRLIGVDSNNWKHQYTHPCWRNLTQLCTAFHRLLIFEPSNTSQYARRKAGLNVVNIDLAEKLSKLFDIMKVEQMQPELVSDEEERKQCSKLKRALQPWVAIWARVISVLKVGQDSALKELRDGIAAQLASPAKADHHRSGTLVDLPAEDYRRESQSKIDSTSKSRTSLCDDLELETRHSSNSTELTATQILFALDDDAPLPRLSVVASPLSPLASPSMKPAKPKKSGPRGPRSPAGGEGRQSLLGEELAASLAEGPGSPTASEGSPSPRGSMTQLLLSRQSLINLPPPVLSDVTTTPTKATTTTTELTVTTTITTTAPTITTTEVDDSVNTINVAPCSSSSSASSVKEDEELLLVATSKPPPPPSSNQPPVTDNGNGPVSVELAVSSPQPSPPSSPSLQSTQPLLPSSLQPQRNSQDGNGRASLSLPSPPSPQSNGKMNGGNVASLHLPPPLSPSQHPLATGSPVVDSLTLSPPPPLSQLLTNTTSSLSPPPSPPSQRLSMANGGTDRGSASIPPPPPSLSPASSPSPAPPSPSSAAAAALAAIAAVTATSPASSPPPPPPPPPSPRSPSSPPSPPSPLAPPSSRSRPPSVSQPS